MPKYFHVCCHTFSTGGIVIDMSSAFAIEMPINVIRRAQCGETVAFKAIYDAFERPAYTLALRLCQCPDAAQEVLQEGMLLVFRKIDQYRFDAPFWGWLRKLFLNACLLELRKQKRWGRWQKEDLEPDGESAPQSCDAELDLARAMGRLSPLRRTILWLHAVEGYSHGEIAQLAHISETNSRAQLSRARRELQNWWSQCDSLAPESALDGV